MLESLLTFAIVAAAFAYAVGVRRLWGAATTARLVSTTQALAFGAAIVVLLVSLSAPFDSLADHDLPWHMVQHLLLITVAAPLLAASDFVMVMARALPVSGRRRVNAVTRRVIRSQTSTGGWIVWTLLAFVLFIVVLNVWHLPPLYDAAIRSAPIHALEHASFILTATLFWWMALGASRRSRRGLGVLVVFVASLPASALGIVMTLSRTPWYAPYGHGSAALVDQQVAGAIMWGFGGSALVIAAAALFASWLASLDRLEASQPPSTAIRS